MGIPGRLPASVRAIQGQSLLNSLASLPRHYIPTRLMDWLLVLLFALVSLENDKRVLG